jgi:hypothetical protein
MGALKGTVTNPHTGKRVNWVLAPGLVKLGAQLDKLGVTWYSIGNADHLKLQGGHTPWKPGAPAGMVTAIDVMKTPDATVEAEILKLMKTAAYDTSWIDFINTNGHQYDWDGRYQGTSGDYHLHLETLGNRTSFTSTLFYDMFGWPTGTKPTPVPAPAVVTKEDDMVLVKLTSRGDVWKSEDGVLWHLSPEQFKAAQAGGFSVKTVATEEELSFYGSEIKALPAKVTGL